MHSELHTEMNARAESRRILGGRRAASARMLVVSAVLLFLTSYPALRCSAATADGSATLALRIRPQAAMTVTSLPAEISTGSDENIQWLRVEMAIRMNPGATASLSLQSAQDSNGLTSGDDLTQSYIVDSPDSATPSIASGNSSQIVFTARQNGRYFLTIGVKSANHLDTNAASTGKIRLELKSSDDLLDLSKTL
jgi:hypothetical protein